MPSITSFVCFLVLGYDFFPHFQACTDHQAFHYKFDKYALGSQLKKAIPQGQLLGRQLRLLFCLFKQ